MCILNWKPSLLLLTFLLVPVNHEHWNFIRHVCKIVKSNCWLHHVCSSICMEQLSSQGMYFHEIWHFSVFQKSVEKIQVWLKTDKKNRYFMWRPIYIYDNNSLSFSSNVKWFRHRQYRKSERVYIQ